MVPHDLLNQVQPQTRAAVDRLQSVEGRSLWLGGTPSPSSNTSMVRSRSTATTMRQVGQPLDIEQELIAHFVAGQQFDAILEIAV